jgi:hypothetical protein
MILSEMRGNAALSVSNSIEIKPQPTPDATRANQRYWLYHCHVLPCKQIVARASFFLHTRKSESTEDGFAAVKGLGESRR